MTSKRMNPVYIKIIFKMRWEIRSCRGASVQIRFFVQLMSCKVELKFGENSHRLDAPKDS